MTQLERSGEQQPGKPTEQQDRSITIQATPLPDTSGIVFQKAPDGGVTIWFQGNITIDLPPAVSEATGAVVSAESDTGYRLLTNGTPSPRSEAQTAADTTAPDKPRYEGTTKDLGPAVPETVEKVVKFTPYTASEPRESILSASEQQGNGLVPASTTEPHNGAHSEAAGSADEASTTENLPDGRQESSVFVPESENEKHEFVGNPVRNPAYWVRESSGTRIADFHLATHSDKHKTQYYRIRAFHDLADRVRDTVRKGQKDVEVVAYGPKYWPVRRKTKDGSFKEEVAEGYYAGMVRVPRKYRAENSQPAAQEPLGQ